MKQVATERIEFARDAIVRVAFKTELAQRIVMQSQNEFGFDARAIILAIGQKLRDREQLVGDALHRGDDDNDVGILGNWFHEFCGMQHARGAEQRSPAKFERYDFLATTKQRGGFALKKFAASLSVSRRARFALRENSRN